MNRFLALLLAAVMLLSLLAACSKDAPDQTAPSGSQSSSETAPVNQSGDTLEADTTSGDMEYEVEYLTSTDGDLSEEDGSYPASDGDMAG